MSEEFEYDYRLDVPSEARIDEIPPTKIMVAKQIVSDSEAEMLFENEKVDIFKGFFRRPKTEDIKVKSIKKSFEPYLLLGGEYEVRYLTQRTYDIDLIDDAVSVFILGEEIIVPEKEEEETEVEIKTKKKPGFFEGLRSRSKKKVSQAEIQITGIEHVHITKEIEEARNYKQLSINPDSLLDVEFDQVSDQFLQTEASMVPSEYLDIDKFTTETITEISKKPDHVQRVLIEKVTITDKKIVLYPVYWAEMIYKGSKEKNIRLDAITRKIEEQKGTRYPPPSFGGTITVKSENQFTGKCPECNQAIEADDKFCESCGVKLQ